MQGEGQRIAALKCKAVVTVGSCLNAMVTPELQGITRDCVIPLMSGGVLREMQINMLSAIYMDFWNFESTREHQKSWEINAMEKVRKILLRFSHS